MNIAAIEKIVQLAKLGLSAQAIRTLLQCERALNRWDCDLCNGDVQEVEGTDTFADRHGRIVRNRGAQALKRAAAAIAGTGYTLRHQGDPRGCSLYLVSPAQPAIYNDAGGIALCA